jgi:hypothetical protein
MATACLLDGMPHVRQTALYARQFLGFFRHATPIARTHAWGVEKDQEIQPEARPGSRPREIEAVKS